MDTDTIRLLTRATRAGLTFTVTDDQVLVTGHPDPELLEQLRTHRAAISAMLTSDACAACGRRPWIREADTAIPWCRAHANQRGLQLLRHEAPHLLETRCAS